MLNYVKIVKQLEQDALPLFCDEGYLELLLVFICRRKNVQVPCTNDRCLEHCIGKYIKSSGVEECIRQTKVSLSVFNHIIPSPIPNPITRGDNVNSSWLRQIASFIKLSTKKYKCYSLPYSRELPKNKCK